MEESAARRRWGLFGALAAVALLGASLHAREGRPTAMMAGAGRFRGVEDAMVRVPVEELARLKAQVAALQAELDAATPGPATAPGRRLQAANAGGGGGAAGGGGWSAAMLDSIGDSVESLLHLGGDAPPKARGLQSHAVPPEMKRIIAQTMLNFQADQFRKEVAKAWMDPRIVLAAGGNVQHPQPMELPDRLQKRVLVTGGAGFVGSHLVDLLMLKGHEVIVVDNMFTGRKRNVQHWMGHRNFQLIVHDVVDPIALEVDQIYHLACPASPPHYQYNPVKTIKTSTEGTLNMLGLAKRVQARILLASTSEVYGDPEVSPQPETYAGHVSTTGPRACYDEGKRVAETMMAAYHRQANVDVRIARIFNTFGPRMHPNDGRVVSNFIIQALQDKDVTIYGTGAQTRSFQYVSDLVIGLYTLMESDVVEPVNLGNPDEYTIGDFASKIVSLLPESKSTVVRLPATQDDPRQRRPDISRAKTRIGWEPRVDVTTGIQRTVEYFRKELERTGEIVPTTSGPTRPKPVAVGQGNQ